MHSPWPEAALLAWQRCWQCAMRPWEFQRTTECSPWVVSSSSRQESATCGKYKVGEWMIGEHWPWGQMSSKSHIGHFTYIWIGDYCKLYNSMINVDDNQKLTIQMNWIIIWMGKSRSYCWMLIKIVIKCELTSATEISQRPLASTIQKIDVLQTDPLYTFVIDSIGNDVGLKINVCVCLSVNRVPQVPQSLCMVRVPKNRSNRCLKGLGKF